MMSIETVLIVLPLPPSILGPNRIVASFGGRMKKAAASKRYRALACREAESQGVEVPWRRSTVQATFFHKTARRRDDVNHLASLKAAYDGVVDGGILEDDDSKHLITLPAVFQLDRDNPRVELLFTRIE